jgi:hypothetical protein
VSASRAREEIEKLLRKLTGASKKRDRAVKNKRTQPAGSQRAKSPIESRKKIMDDIT